MKFRISLVSLFFLVVSASVLGQVQEDKSKRPSPPAEARAVIDSSDVAVFYSTPAVKGRIVWGGLVPYGKLWRTGANEATVFETSRDLVVKDTLLPAGKYALFTIPGEQEWIFIFNSVWNQWGSFKYDVAKDVLRVKVPAEKSAAYTERFKLDLENNDLSLFWENVVVHLPLGSASITSTKP